MENESFELFHNVPYRYLNASIFANLSFTKRMSYFQHSDFVFLYGCHTDVLRDCGVEFQTYKNYYPLWEDGKKWVENFMNQDPLIKDHYDTIAESSRPNYIVQQNAKWFWTLDQLQMNHLMKRIDGMEMSKLVIGGKILTILIHRFHVFSR